MKELDWIRELREDFESGDRLFENQTDRGSRVHRRRSRIARLLLLQWHRHRKKRKKGDCNLARICRKGERNGLLQP